MLMPGIFGEDLFNDWFSFPDIDKKFYGKSTDQVMKTDIKEKDNEYEVDIELPGYKKEDVKAELKDGYLTISAAKNVNNDEKKEDGKYIRKERFSGNVSRSFYVGEDMTQEDIHAKFEDGILKLTVPKKEAKKVEDKKSYITIEG
nr:Hsp20/alpha crystallin family protein [uncultured Anaerostipes sp.]